MVFELGPALPPAKRIQIPTGHVDGKRRGHVRSHKSLKDRAVVATLNRKRPAPVRHTNEHKLNVINQMVDERLTINGGVDKFGIKRATLHRWMQNRAQIESACHCAFSVFFSNFANFIFSYTAAEDVFYARPIGCRSTRPLA